MADLRCSETFVNFYQAIWGNIPEDKTPHSLRREKVKSQNFLNLRQDRIDEREMV
jgi:hypothetical protein